MTNVMKVCLMLVLIAPACNDKDATDGPTATATLIGLNSSGVSGTVRFMTQGDDVHVEGDISGLTPGMHGIHVHEFGDCSAPDGTSAGSHFNPQSHPHGAPGDTTHPGDLGNIEADAQGKARLSVDLPQATVDAGPLGLVGRSLIVHEMVDDLKTQPTGNSGARLACAVIQADAGSTVPVVEGAKN